VGHAEAASAGVHGERELGVDLREVGEVALLPVGMVARDRAAQPGAVDVQRAAVDDDSGRRARDRLGDEAGAGEIGLLRVVGVALGDRPAGLGGEHHHSLRAGREQPVQRGAIADVGRLDHRAALLERGELSPRGRAPVVRQDHRLPPCERELSHRRADVAGAEDQDHRFRWG
jgi:hypothetical protein